MFAPPPSHLPSPPLGLGPGLGLLLALLSAACDTSLAASATAVASAAAASASAASAVTGDPCALPPPHPEPEVIKAAGAGRGVNATARTQLLHLHNTLRQRVATGEEKRGAPGPQPPAANMAVLKWDQGLANFSQLWADRRVFQHNPCRRTKKYPFIGENLALQVSQGPTPEYFGWKKAITDWYDEVIQFPKTKIEKYQFNPNTGHYTQLAWAESTKVGCGYSSYKKGNFTYHLYVCNYAPGGNVVRAPVYAKGTPRSRCRRRRVHRRYPALCLL